MQEVTRLKGLYRSALTSVTMYTSDILTDYVRQAWLVQIPTTNLNQQNSTFSTQNLSILNIMMNYVVDL